MDRIGFLVGTLSGMLLGFVVAVSYLQMTSPCAKPVEIIE